MKDPISSVGDRHITHEQQQQLLPLPSCPSSCLQKFAKDGHWYWVQDWDFAKIYGQFEEPWVEDAGPYVKRNDHCSRSL